MDKRSDESSNPITPMTMPALRALLIEMLLQPPSQAEARVRVDADVVTIGQAWAAVEALPADLAGMLCRPHKLDIVMLDHGVAEVQRRRPDLPALAARGVLLSLHLALLGGPEGLQRAGAFYATALFPPAGTTAATSDAPCPSAPASEADEDSDDVDEPDYIIHWPDETADCAVVAACVEMPSALTAFDEAEEALAGMSQGDPGFKAACERADRLRAASEHLLDLICETQATTFRGRFFKAKALSQLGRLMPYGPAQETFARRLYASLSQDYARSRSGGGESQGGLTE